MQWIKYHRISMHLTTRQSILKFKFTEPQLKLYMAAQMLFIFTIFHLIFIPLVRIEGGKLSWLPALLINIPIYPPAAFVQSVAL